MRKTERNKNEIKKISSLFITTIMMLAIVQIPVVTSETVLMISNAEERIEFRESVNNGDDYSGVLIKLMNNIDLGGSETNRWKPIGKYADEYNVVPFNGIFDGCCYEISGLYINDSARDNQSLFVYSTGAIKNLGVDEKVVGREQVAGIVAWGRKNRKLL